MAGVMVMTGILVLCKKNNKKNSKLYTLPFKSLGSKNLFLMLIKAFI